MAPWWCLHGEPLPTASAQSPASPAGCSPSETSSSTAVSTANDAAAARPPRCTWAGASSNSEQAQRKPAQMDAQSTST
eukprot:2999043-Prymnesium_polylepis.1